MPDVERTDWTSEEVVRDTVHEETYKLAGLAIARFKRVGKAHEDVWAERILEGIAPPREKARAALIVAVTQMREWRAVVDAGASLPVDTGRFGTQLAQHADRSIQPSVLMGQLDMFLAMVESDDPIVSGSDLTEERR